MPHPNKAHRGGEDAVFLSDDGLFFGQPHCALHPALPAIHADLLRLSFDSIAVNAKGD
jgi:hypothetical protein